MEQQIANFMDGISVPLFFVTLAVVAAPLALVHELGHAFWLSYDCRGT